MSFPIYHCPPTLPEQIPVILGAQGFTVQPRDTQYHKDYPNKDPRAFAFTVSRGHASAIVYGGQEHGTTYFHTVCNSGWPWKQARLIKEIETTLFANGAQHMKLHEEA